MVRCTHPFLRWPTRYVEPGTPCPDCGARTKRPSSFNGAQPEEIEQLRATWEAIALWFRVRDFYGRHPNPDPNERGLSPQAAKEMLADICAMQGWDDALREGVVIGNETATAPSR